MDGYVHENIIYFSMYFCQDITTYPLLSPSKWNSRFTTPHATEGPMNTHNIFHLMAPGYISFWNLLLN